MGMTSCCIECGKRFRAISSRAILCGGPCRTARTARLARERLGFDALGRVRCECCGITFTKRSHNQKMCGNGCRQRMVYQKRAERQKEARAKWEAKYGKTYPNFIKQGHPGNQFVRKYDTEEEQREARNARRRVSGDGERRAVRPVKVSAVVNFETEVLPCESCRHWKPMKGADLGGFCDIGRWLICKPLAQGAKPYAPKGGAYA